MAFQDKVSWNQEEKAAQKGKKAEPVKEEKPKPEAPKERVKEEESGKPSESLEAADYCQICRSRNSLQKHYIIPLDRGGKDEEGNMILLCRIHKEQAEKGMYSENLLRRLKNI